MRKEYPGGTTPEEAFAASVSVGNQKFIADRGPCFDFREYCHDNRERVLKGLPPDERQRIREQFPMPRLTASDNANSDLPNNYLPLERPFFTMMDGYTGVGPINIQEGDKICVLFGVNAPFVLRSTDGYCKLVVDCYIHGDMKGEAIMKWRDGELTDQYFELR
jgi:hypothetical protein